LSGGFLLFLLHTLAALIGSATARRHATSPSVVFGFGLLLSVYRDRLLALPEKIKRREGVCRVLGWR
jgi:hypothetical protein